MINFFKKLNYAAIVKSFYFYLIIVILAVIVFAATRISSCNFNRKLEKVGGNFNTAENTSRAAGANANQIANERAGDNTQTRDAEQKRIEANRIAQNAANHRYANVNASDLEKLGANYK